MCSLSEDFAPKCGIFNDIYHILEHERLFKDNGMEGVEMRWWQGAEVFQGGYGVEDGIKTTPGFQDTLDDILPRLAFLPGEER